MNPKRVNTAELYLKKFRQFSFLFLFLFLPLFFIGLLLWWKWAISPVNPQTQEKEIFIIQRGESTTSVINRLKERNFIKSPFAFKLLLRKDRLENKIQAGDFRLSRAMNAREVALQLSEGRLDVWVTIPEGLRREEIFEILQKEGLNIDKEQWFKITEGKEGFLFPDTYLIPQEASAGAVVQILLENFEKKVKTIGKTYQKEDIIIASLLEREVKTEEDKFIVSGIIKKRLEEGWPLEIDATVQYALATQFCQNKKEKNCWWPVVDKDDLKIDSPFNTYKISGLPPEPICNPSLSSIKAALFPKMTDYWFYISDKEGNLHFAKNLEEQERNIDKYLR